MKLLVGVVFTMFLISCWRNETPSAISNSTPISSQPIGTRYFQWTDSSRTDNYYGGQRLINVQVWYPAELSDTSKNTPTAPYYYKIEEAIPYLEGWSRSDLQQVLGIPTRSRLNAPIRISGNTFPLLLFSPTLGGNLSNYTYYAEQLADSGYIVVGINHLYESEYVFSVEQEILPANLHFHDSLKTLDIPAQISVDDYRATKGIRQRVLGQDILYALDKILQLNTPLFNNQIDSSRVGCWGHSIGGAASIFAAYLDERIRAVVNLDGTPPSIALENGIKVPFLFIEDLTDYNNHPGYAKLHARRNEFCHQNEQSSYRILINGINHNSFQDLNYRLADTSQEKEEELLTLQQVSSYMKTFFDHHLNENTSRVFAEQKSDSLEILVFHPN